MRRAARAALLGVAMIFFGEAAAADDIKDGGWQSWCIGRFLIDMPAGFALLQDWGAVGRQSVDPLGAGGAGERDTLYRARVEAVRSGRATQDDVPLKLRETGLVGTMPELSYWLDFSELGVDPTDWIEEIYLDRDGALFRVAAPVREALAEDDMASARIVAEAVHPRAPGEAPRGQGACLPGAFVALPPTTENHGGSFGPGGGMALGFEFSIVARRAVDPAYAPDPGILPGHGRAITMGGLEGRENRIADNALSFLAVAGQGGGGGRDGTTLTLRFFDQRPDFGTGVQDRAWAEATWERIIASVRPKP